MRKAQEQLEKEQWRRLVKSDAQALEWLFDNFSQSLFNYGMKVVTDRELVKDCIQDLFSEIWNSRSRIVVPESPRFYLFKALKYKILRDTARHQRTEAFNEACAETEFESSAESRMILQQTAIENRSAVQNALKKLTQRQREVLMLRYFEEMSHEEIASLLQINKQSVYNLIFSALTALKKAALPELSLLHLVLAGFAAVGLAW